MQHTAFHKLCCFRDLCNSALPRLGAVRYCNVQTKNYSKETSAYKKNAVSINIPKRIERSHTDILKALASTIRRDHTAPHYRYHDDPYLIPNSNFAKRSFALSKESGKKAAKWILQEHGDLFNHRVADPPIEAFFPNPTFSEESDVDESTLQSLIDTMLLTESIKVYEILKRKGKEISNRVKQSLLEFICYYNETEPLDEDLIEERWYKSGGLAREKLKNSWKEGGIAEQIFLELDPQDAAAHCALIRGRAKYYQVEKAWQMYKEMESKGLQVDVDTFNSLLQIVNFLRENSDMRWQLTEEILSDMERRSVAPNVGTLNAVLETVSTYGNIRQGKQLCLKVLAEFKKQGIEPSLASYYNILNTHCKDRGPPSTILVDIMREIEGKTFTIQDPKDTYFFLTAMDVCRNHLQDLTLAQKVDDLLHLGDNYNLIGDSFKESIYYRHFVALKCNFETFDSFMEFYNKIVPNIYTPEPGIMEEILTVLESNGAINHLAQLWSDMIIFEQTRRENLLTLVLRIMASNFPSSNDADFAKLSPVFSNIGWKIWEIIELWDEEKVRTVNWTGQMLGDLLAVQVKANDFDRASEVMKRLLRSSQDVLGIPTLDALTLFLDAAINEQSQVMCLACIQYIGDTGFPEVVELGEKVYANVRLDSYQTLKLSNIVGFDVSSSKADAQKL